MAVLAAILPVVSRGSCLALELYQFAASSPGQAKDLIEVAKAINNFASILKQVGTIIKEDDRLPSYEVCFTLHINVYFCASPGIRLRYQKTFSKISGLIPVWQKDF